MLYNLVMSEYLTISETAKLLNKSTKIKNDEKLIKIYFTGAKSV